MIGRRGKWLLFLYVLFLVVLFLMCSTDLIIREPEREIYQIAVIIEDVRGDNYGNFRKGMEQAAAELNADVHFITLYEQSDVRQQLELMEREKQDGADALIVVPVDERQLAEKQMGIPVIFLHSGRTESTGSGSIVIDYKKMGEELAQEMSKGLEKSSPVLILTDPQKQNSADRYFLDGAETVLMSGSYSVQKIPKDEEGGFGALMQLPETEQEEMPVLLAQNTEILTAMAGILSESPEAAKRVRGLYGRGSTLSVLNYLDRGQITGICVTDEFSIGYFSVSAAVRALEGDVVQNPVIMDSYYIEKDDVREPDYEKMLFPIE